MDKQKTRELYHEMNKRKKPTDDSNEVLQQNYLKQLNHDRIDVLTYRIFN